MGLNEAQKKERADYLENNLDITECSQKRPFAFISYASDNWETVFKKAVVPLQKQYGLRVYADKAFDKVNDKWIVPMLRNVRGADLMIAFVSQSYIESYACFLELLTAVNNKKQIVFVALDQELRLGDTTDQPNVERGVKNEILNQGANISTNTNNSSNDIMRAMKSAFTSISTLLEQDALSKYDISDAFINFFRDASINKKTINDLGALSGTIQSVSSNVFEKTAYKGAKQPEPQAVPVYQPEAQTAEPEVQTAAYQPEAQTVKPEVQMAAYQPEAQAAELEVQSAADFSFDVPEPKKPEKAGFDLHNKKFLAVLIGGVCALAAIIVVVLIAVMPKHVEAMSYEFSMLDGNERRVYTGTYTGDWKNGMPYEEGTFIYEADDEDNENGFVYEGEWADGLANGQGTRTYASGAVYEGEFADGTFNGEGTMTYAEDDANGRRDYVGEWVDGKKHGQGVMTWNSGQVYEGEWADDVPNGQGTIIWADGRVYEGELADGKQNGEGTMTYAEDDANGRRDYVGEWIDGKKNGQGIMTWNSGQVYEGEWADDVPNGQGAMTYAEDDEYGRRDYVGEWADGKYNGQGTMTYAEDDEYGRRDYVGEWVDGKKNGQGVMTWNDGEVYEGEYADDARNGQGTYTFADGTEITGEWENGGYVIEYGDGSRYVGHVNKNGKPQGQGTMTYADGGVYEGEWADGKFNGQGKQIYPSGGVYEGEFLDGKYNGQGTYTWTSGAVYEGEWTDGKINGHGKYTYSDGTVQEGEWKDGEFVG